MNTQRVALECLAKRPSPDNLPALKDGLDHLPTPLDPGEFGLPEALIAAIENIKGDESVALLQYAYASRDPRLQAHARRALERRQAPLKADLSDSRSEVVESPKAKERRPRKAGARARVTVLPEAVQQQQLAELDEAARVRFAAEHLSNQSYTPRLLVDALICIKTAESSLVLRRLLDGDDGPSWFVAATELVRRSALTPSPRDQAIMLFFGHPQDPDALRALGQIAADVVGKHWRGTEHELTSLELLWDYEHPQRVAITVPLLGLSVTGKNFGKAALRWLRKAPVAAEPQLLEALASRPYQSAGIMEALGAIRSKAAVPALLERFRPNAKEHDLAMCAYALGRSRDERAIGPLIAAVEWIPEGRALRKLYAALGEINAIDGLPAVSSRALKDPRLNLVRDRTVEKLQKSAGRR